MAIFYHSKIDKYAMLKTFQNALRHYFINRRCNESVFCTKFCGYSIRIGVMRFRRGEIGAVIESEWRGQQLRFFSKFMLKTFQIISAVFKRVQQNLSGDWGLLLLSLQIAHMTNYTPTSITATHLLHLEVEAGSIAPPAKVHLARARRIQHTHLWPTIHGYREYLRATDLQVEADLKTAGAKWGQLRWKRYEDILIRNAVSIGIIN